MRLHNVCVFGQDMALLALVILSFLLPVDAKLEANYPINAQLPPVGRVSQLFQFEFSPRTFVGSDSETTYSLSNAPSWLQVNSDNRTLTGTPQSNDVGENTFNLVATDQSGSADMQVTLIVTEDEGPKLGKPILPQLEKCGPTSFPSTIFVYPGDPFSISFAPDTFTNTHPSTVYYGTTQDNAPLPSWVRFDPSELKFYGSAPDPPSSGRQSYTFHLIASDVAGFSAATVSFDMVISPHILAFNDSKETLYISRGEHFTSPQFIDDLRLDGKEPANKKLTSVELESPDWVHLDKDSIILSGTPPESAAEENATITVKDIYHDVAKLRVVLKFSRLFNGGIEGCNATIGEDFMFVFNQSILANASVDLDVDMGEQLSSWLQYTPENKTLHGHVPEDLQPQTYSINLTATQGSMEDTREFTINIVEPDHSRDTSPSSDSGGGGMHWNKAGIIAISVVIPCVFLGTVLLLFCCWRRKRRAAAHEEERLPQEKEHRQYPDVSGLPNCQPSEENTRDEVPEALGGQPESPKAPKLELGPLWSADSFEEKESAGNAANRENLAANSTIGWDFAPLRDPEPQEKQTEATSTQNKRNSRSSPVRRQTSNRSGKREPLKPIQPRRSMKRNSATSSKSRRNSKRSSGISSVASGLPTRISGAGHGAGGFGPPGYGVVRLSWQSPQAGLPSDESSLESLTPLFPRPPPGRGRGDSQSSCKPGHLKQMSLRTVESRHSTISEGDSFEEFVQNRAKCRNSSNPMFSGHGNRRVSSGVRALERARSTPSRGETGTTTSSYNDSSRQSMRDRPTSSVYSDDIGPPGQGRGVSQYASVSPNITFSKRQSQSSVAQKYRDMAAPLPRSFSESSLASGRKGGLGNGTGYPENYSDVVDGRSEDGQRQSSSWVSCYSLSSVVGMYQPRTGRSSSSSEPLQGKTRRESQVRIAGRDGQAGREESTESGRGDMAFV